MHLLSYAPYAGVPQAPDPGLRLWGDLSAIYHAPALLLNSFACRRVHVPDMLLCGNLIASGYTLTLVILRFAWWMLGGH